MLESEKSVIKKIGRKEFEERIQAGQYYTVTETLGHYYGISKLLIILSESYHVSYIGIPHSTCIPIPASKKEFFLAVNSSSPTNADDRNSTIIINPFKTQFKAT